MDHNTLPTCPKCKQTDQIQKVTSLYGANTEEWYEMTQTGAPGHSTSHRVHHEAHTQLGLKLHPPPKPPGPMHPGWLWGLVGFIVLILCPFAFFPCFFLIPIVVPLFTDPSAMRDIQTALGIPSGTVLAAIIGGGILCIGLAALGVIVSLGRKVKQRFDRNLAEYKAKKTMHDRDELPRWQSAQNRWEQLYYCMRDETIFIPAENKAIRVDDMAKYLYDPLFRSNP